MGDEPKQLEAFIPSVLDEAGLSPAEFRVFCRIKRRGECTEGVPKMAVGCKLHPDTIWEALSRFVELNMVIGVVGLRNRTTNRNGEQIGDAGTRRNTTWNYCEIESEQDSRGWRSIFVKNFVPKF